MHLLEFKGCLSDEDHTTSYDDNIKILDIQDFNMEMNVILNKPGIQIMKDRWYQLPDGQNHALDVISKEDMEFIFCGCKSSQNRNSPRGSSSVQLPHSNTNSSQPQSHTQYGISLHPFSKDEQCQQLQSSDITWDIDSIIGRATSLAVAQQGLRMTFFPSRLRNIVKDVHLTHNFHLSDENGRFKRVNIPYHKIPHLYLGSIHGIDLTIYVFFPKLFRPKATNNFLTDKHLEQWVDAILLPTLKGVLPGSILHHLPRSFFQAKRDSSATSRETGVQDTDEGRILNRALHYYIQGEFLDIIWSMIVEKCNQEGYQHFAESFLVVNGKNLKLMTQQPTPAEAIEKFVKLLSQTCNLSKFSPDFTYVDDGKEITPQPDEDLGGLTYLWRRCCLKSYIERAKMGVPRPGNLVGLYRIGFLNEAINMTFIPGQRHPLRYCGLVYSQFYSITKEMFDASKTMPFQNSAIEALVVDPGYRKLLDVVGKRVGNSWDESKLKKNYIASKERSLAILDGNPGDCYGIREEHRMSFKMLYGVIKALKEKKKFDQQITGGMIILFTIYGIHY